LLGGLNKVLDRFGELGKLKWDAGGAEKQSVHWINWSFEIDEAMTMAVSLIKVLAELKQSIDERLGCNCTYIVKTAE